MDVIAGAAAVPDAPNVLLAAAAAAVLCGLVIAEIAALPGVLLPGGTMTLLAGALIGSGRPAARRSAPVSTPRRQTGKLARRAAAASPARPNDHPSDPSPGQIPLRLAGSGERVTALARPGWCRPPRARHPGRGRRGVNMAIIWLGAGP